MTIKEIARLADCSISTVSKVINGKDYSISEKTRERILSVVKEYNYLPYAKFKNKDSHSFLLAVIVNDDEDVNSDFLRGVISLARKNGYTLIVNHNASTEEEEIKMLDSLSKQNPDGLIWEKNPEQARKLTNKYLGKGVSIISIGLKDYMRGVQDYYHIDYKKLGFMLTEALLCKHHKVIRCFVPNKKNQSCLDFIEGYRSCLYIFGISYNQLHVQVVSEDFSINQTILMKVTGVICYNLLVALRIHNQVQAKNMDVPKDLSILALASNSISSSFFPNIATLDIQSKKFGEYIGQKLVNIVERTTQVPEPLTYKYNITNLNIISSVNEGVPRMLVIGSVNMDTLIHVSRSPVTGVTEIAKDCKNLIGGKGANQATGLAKLGVATTLLARIGKDTEGMILYDSIVSNKVSHEHIIFDNTMDSGKAYVFVVNNGESSITVYLGANANLSCKDIDANIHAFDNVQYCLLQTEISTDMVIYAAEICKKRGIKTILKPSNLYSESAHLLKNIDYFVPNEREAECMSNGRASYESQADYFRKLGVSTVIITLGKKGCYFRDETHSLYFTAISFPAVDTTGAADAFIAALATSLAKGADIIKAIKIASYAGSFSITKEGAQSAMIDSSMLEEIWNTIDSLIEVSPNCLSISGNL